MILRECNAVYPEFVPQELRYECSHHEQSCPHRFSAVDTSVLSVSPCIVGSHYCPNQVVHLVKVAACSLFLRILIRPE